MDFKITFDGPEIVKLGEGSLSLRRLSIYDYREWVSELEQKFRDRNIPLIPDDATKAEKARTLSGIYARKFSPDDIAPTLFQIDTIDRIIKLSFVKSLTSKRLCNNNEKDPDVAAALAKAESFIEDNGCKATEMLAVRLSNLCTVAQYEGWYGVKAEAVKPPNAGAGESPANQSTGS